VVPDAQGGDAYTRQFGNLLGLVSQINGQYNYDAQGNVLPQGAGISRDFVPTRVSRSTGRIAGS